MAFQFFTRVLNAVKGDTTLAILWGFGVLLLVVLIATFVLARDLAPIMKLIVVFLVVSAIAVLFVHTVPQAAQQGRRRVRRGNLWPVVVILALVIVALGAVAMTLIPATPPP